MKIMKIKNGEINGILTALVSMDEAPFENFAVRLVIARNVRALRTEAETLNAARAAAIKASGCALEKGPDGQEFISAMTPEGRKFVEAWASLMGQEVDVTLDQIDGEELGKLPKEKQISPSLLSYLLPFLK